MRGRIGLLAFSFLLLLGCGKDQAVLTDLSISKTYQYASYVGGNRTPAVIGTFTLNVSNSKTIDGEWAFEKYGPFDNIGPQIGAGKLKGTVDNGILYINLNPGYADNNVILTATLQDEAEGIFGKWSWVTFVGPTSEGQFEAIPVN